MRNFGSILLIICLVLITPVMLLVTSIKYNVVTPRFLKRELASHNMYALAIGQLDQQILKLNIDPQYPVTHQEIITLAHDIISEDWLRHNIESTIDHIFAWLNAPDNAVLSIPLDIRQQKVQLAHSIDGLLATKLPQLKPCPGKRIPKQEQGICQFAGLTVPQVKEQLKHAGFDVVTITTVVPDTLDLVNPDLSLITGAPKESALDPTQQKNKEIMAKLTNVKNGYQQTLQYFLLAWIGYGVLLAGYIVLNATKGRRRLVRWVGILGISIGIIPLGMAIAARVLVQQKLLPMIRFNGNVPSEVQSIVPQLVMDFQNALFISILVTGAILVGMGLASIIDAHFLPPSAKQKKS